VSLCGYSTQNVTDCKGVARREATSSAALKAQGIKPALKTQLRRELKHYAAAVCREPHFFIDNRLLTARLFLVRAGRSETRPPWIDIIWIGDIIIRRAV
jgi:hypothetical protein